jgi:hypothetical protein
MEKGIKTLQTTARTAQRKASADQNQAFCEDRGISDHNSDSGIVLCSGSEPDVEVDESETAPFSRHGHGASASWSESYSRQQERLHQEHMRSRSLPLPLPQYQPPAPRAAPKPYGHEVTGPTSATNLGAISYDRPAYASQRYSPETQQRLSIQSVLIPEEPEEDGQYHETMHDQHGRQSSRIG